MKHKGAIEINQTLEKVAALFSDPRNLKEYQDGFVEKELLSGEQGEVGSVSKMVYQHGKQDMILIETITKNELPHSFEAFFHHEHMDNTMKCRFIALGEMETRYEYEYEYEDAEDGEEEEYEYEEEDEDAEEEEYEYEDEDYDEDDYEDVE